MRPLIGILTGIDSERTINIQNTYIEAIERSGGTPIVLPYIKDDETVCSLVGRCDGFLFSGGVDIDPKHYGEQKKDTCGEIQPYRDEFELRIFQKAIGSSKPILAICRGIQLINVALGGTLYQDIPTEIPSRILHRQSEPKDEPSHEVKIIEDTPLRDLIGAGRMKANSFHHQAVKDLGKGLAVMAVSDDGMIEAVYLQGEQYLRAYQWHPERLCNTDKDNRRIFDDFTEACKK